MARVIYPLMSLSAYGIFGRHIVYSRARFGGTRARFQPFARWKKTPKRKWLLRKFSEVSNEWWLLTPSEREAYNQKAKQVRDSGYALWVKEQLTGVVVPDL